MVELKEMADKALLELYAELMDEARRRKLIRSNNNPVSDYAEKLVAEKMTLKLCSKSTKGFDAEDVRTKIRFQIKGRRITQHNKSRQLGVIRYLWEGKYFDYLIAVIFDDKFNVKEAYKIPHDIIEKHARYSEIQNGHILHVDDTLIFDQAVENITTILK